MYVEKRLRQEFKERCDYSRAGKHDNNIQHWTDDLCNVMQFTST